MPLLGGSKQWSMPVIGGYVGNITTSYNSWGSYNTSYYRWALPDEGWYELHANLRVRVWGTTGFTRFRILRASDSSAYGGSDNIKMGLETQQSTANYLNAQLHYIWKVYISSADTFYLQGYTSTNSSGHSLQSDGNGRNECMWRRID